MQRARCLFPLLLCLSLVLSYSFVSAAGEDGIELRGTVSDQAGAIIVEASVELLGTHTYATLTNGQGQYHFTSIMPGRYTLKVTAKGFAAFTQEVDLPSRRVAPLNVSLRILLSDRIEVRNDTAAVSTEPENNLSGLTLSEEDLRALPDDPNELLRVLRLMAGTVGGGPLAIYLDGFSHSGRLPPKSAIQSVRINSNPFAAEFSEPGRGRIEITTKPGSSSFHGEFAFNFNDSVLNARNAFAPSRAPLQVRNYSGYFNGPIVPNRWDFLVYAGVWQQDGNSIVNTILLNLPTLVPRPFTTTVVTPTANADISLHSNFLWTSKQTIGLGYSLGSSEAQNQGLQGGFDLPERAFNSSSRNDALRFSLTSIPSNRLLNQIRIQLRRFRFESESLTSSPALLVFGAFNAGGNQGSLFNQIFNTGIQAADILSYTRSRHTLKLGLRADAVYLQNINRANFNGTFTFGTDFERDSAGSPLLGNDKQPIIITSLEHYRRTLLGLPGYRASQFSIIRGDPSISFSQREFSWFVQDDWRISRHLTLSYGLRHEFQTNLDDRLNLAPRFGIAWAPGKSQQGVVRFGTGLFYNRIEPGITFDTIRLDGKNRREILIDQPAFFPDVPAEFSGSTSRFSTLRKKAANLNAPYLIISTISYERQLPWKMLGSANYTWQRGIHLLRTRNINSPVPGTAVRPFPDLGQVLQFESTGLSTRHELRLTLRTSISRKLSLFGNYTLASIKTDTEGPYSTPADPYNLSNEFARASSDERHRLYMGGSISLPRNLRFSPFLSISSGRPFNITTGRDNNRDALFTDRPAFASADAPGAVATPVGTFNPNPSPRDKLIPRNLGDGPGQVNINASLSKTFSFNYSAAASGGQKSHAGRERLNLKNKDGGSSSSESGNAASTEPRSMHLTVSVNIENIFNHTNFGAFNGVLKSPFFGRANRALEARRISLGATFSF